jgi:hypothetical protein
LKQNHKQNNHGIGRFIASNNNDFDAAPRFMPVNATAKSRKKDESRK